MTAKLHPGTSYTKNGVTVVIDCVKDGEVYVQRWPKGVEWQSFFVNCIRMPIKHFIAQLRRRKSSRRKWWRVEEWRPTIQQWVEIGSTPQSFAKAIAQAEWNLRHYGRTLRVVECTETIRRQFGVLPNKASRMD